MNNIISIKNISKIYFQGRRNEFSAIKDISLDIKKGEFIAIMGPSGSGKSTLLNCISTLDSTSTGCVYIDQININALSQYKLNDFRYKRLGFVFQDYNLIPEFTNYQNIALPLFMHRVTSEIIANEVEKIAKKIGIENILNQFPCECSGGQQQKVSIARALITSPKILIADEPTGNLDSKTSKDILTLFSILNQKGVTILLVTHDSFIASFSKKVIFMKDGKVINQIERGNMNQKKFYEQIMMHLEKN